MAQRRHLSYGFKLPGRSISEVYEAFNHALTRHQGAGRVKFNGRKLSAEAMVNAAMLDFLARPPAEQEAILARRVAEFEAMVAGTADSPPATAGMIGPEAEVRDVTTRGVAADDRATPKARGRKGSA